MHSNVIFYIRFTRTFIGVKFRYITSLKYLHVIMGYYKVGQTEMTTQKLEQCGTCRYWSFAKCKRVTSFNYLVKTYENCWCDKWVES